MSSILLGPCHLEWGMLIQLDVAYTRVGQGHVVQGHDATFGNLDPQHRIKTVPEYGYEAGGKHLGEWSLDRKTHLASIDAAWGQI